jgi:Ca2+-binding RTX toxin-like protein
MVELKASPFFPKSVLKENIDMTFVPSLELVAAVLSDEVYHSYSMYAPPGWVQIQTPLSLSYDPNTGYYGELWVQQKTDANGNYLPVTNPDGTLNLSNIANAIVVNRGTVFSQPGSYNTDTSGGTVNLVSTYTSDHANTIDADIYAILTNKPPSYVNSGEAFLSYVEGLLQDTSIPITVAGQSLGGLEADAEYVGVKGVTVAADTFNALPLTANMASLLGEPSSGSYSGITNYYVGNEVYTVNSIVGTPVGNIVTLPELPVWSSLYYAATIHDTTSAISQLFQQETTNLSLADYNSAVDWLKSIYANVNPSDIKSPELVRILGSTPSSPFDTGDSQITSNSDGTYTISFGSNDDNVPLQTYTYNANDQLLYSAQINGDESETFTFNNGSSLTFGNGTYVNPSYNSSQNTLTISLTDASDEILGSLTYDANTDTGSLTLKDGLPIALNSIPQNAIVTDPPTSPEQVLLGYLSGLGDPLTAAQLDAMDVSYLDPTVANPAPYFVAGTVYSGGSGYAVVDYDLGPDAAPGAIIAGQSTAIVPGTSEPVPATNFLRLTGDVDLTQDTISNIQILEGGTDFMTGAQFDSIGQYTNSSVTITTSGTYTLNSSSIASVTADDWGGTTLIDNSTVALIHELQASLFGNDTLITTNSYTQLIAGEGVDTLTGSPSGGNSFLAYDGFAPGSIVTGFESGNTLLADGDIGGATISGIQNFIGSATLTADQLSGFSYLSGEVSAASGGTYSAANATTASGFVMTATSFSGTTLIGSNSGSLTLNASSLGNDTLQAGDGQGDILIAGVGVDTLIGGTGGDTFEATTGLTAGSVIEGNGTGNTLQANGDISGATISGVQTLDAEGITLTASQISGFSTIEGGGEINAATGGIYDISGKSTNYFTLDALSDQGTTLIGNNADGETLIASSAGNDTLIAGNGAGDTLAAGGTGNDTLQAGNGQGDNIDGGSGLDTLIGGTGGDTFALPSNANASDILEGQGTGNSLYFSGDISGMTISGIQSLETVYVTLTARQLAGFSTIIFPASGVGHIDAVGGGTFDIEGLASSRFDMIAGSNAGTALIGNDADGETLSASSSGNDTLEAGNGDQDRLYAGSGNDTLIAGNGAGDLLVDSFGPVTMIGGLGGDTFQAYGLVAGSSVQGRGTGNTVLINGDISGFSITGVQTLQTQYVTLTASQFVGFSSIVSGSGTGGTISAATGGTFDLEGKSTENYTLIALSNEGTTLIGNDSNGEQLDASASGNDTLQSGNGNNDVLQAGNGTDTLVAGGGTGDRLYAGFAGNTTLIAGTGGDYLTAGGTTGNDTFMVSATGNDVVTGGSGSSTAVFFGAPSNYAVTDAAGGVTVTNGGTGAIDTLTGIQALQFGDGSLVSIAGNVLTQQNPDGTIVVSTFNITGEPYASSVLTYASAGDLNSALYSGVSGEGNLSSYEYLYTSGALTGTDEFYAGITGQPYTTEETDYNGAGLLARSAFSGVTGQPYSSYEYDYVGGVFARAQYTFTTVPAGASYSSYVVDQSPANTFAGEQFYFTNLPGQPYTGEEVDFDATVSLTRVVLTGVQNQAYSSLELDYAGGAYTGYKAYYTGLTGPYSSEEVDVSASNQLEKVVYSGLTSTPYSSVEQDYSGGALSDVIYSFTDVTGQPYYAYQVEETPGGSGLQETLDLASGGHDLIALASSQTLTSQGLDTMTGSATGATTFVLNAIYGRDTITNLTTADTVSLPQAEFAAFNALLGAAQNQGANVVITAGDGDTLTLNNMTKTQLTGMAANFTFHG